MEGLPFVFAPEPALPASRHRCRPAYDSAPAYSFASDDSPNVEELEGPRALAAAISRLAEPGIRIPHAVAGEMGGNRAFAGLNDLASVAPGGSPFVPAPALAIAL